MKTICYLRVSSAVPFPINVVKPWLTSTSQSDATGSLPKSFRQNSPESVFLPSEVRDLFDPVVRLGRAILPLDSLAVEQGDVPEGSPLRRRVRSRLERLTEHVAGGQCLACAPCPQLPDAVVGG